MDVRMSAVLRRRCRGQLRRRGTLEELVPAVHRRSLEHLAVQVDDSTGEGAVAFAVPATARSLTLLVGDHEPTVKLPVRLR
jgi:hypothetical protein